MAANGVKGFTCRGLKTVLATSAVSHANGDIVLVGADPEIEAGLECVVINE
jgi:hypothetical protein